MQRYLQESYLKYSTILLSKVWPKATTSLHLHRKSKEKGTESFPSSFSGYERWSTDKDA